MNIPPTGYNQAAYAPGGYSQVDGPPRGGEPPQGFGGEPSSPAATVEFSQESMRMSKAGGPPAGYGQPGGFGGPGAPGGPGGPNTYGPPTGNRGVRGQSGPPPEMQRVPRGQQEPQYREPMME